MLKQIKDLGIEKLIPDNNDLIPFQGSNGITGHISRENFLGGLSANQSNISPGLFTKESLFLAHLQSNIVDIRGSTLTSVGSAVISSTQKVFGNGSLYFPGSSYFLSSTHEKFNLSGDFLMEAFVWLPSAYNFNNLYANFLTIDSGGSDFISVGKNRSGLNNQWYGQIYINGTSTEVYSATPPSAGQWNHFSLIRQANVVGLRINEKLQSQVLQQSPFLKFSNNATRVSIGCIPAYLPNQIPALMGAYLTEVQICAYSYPVPLQPYT